MICAVFERSTPPPSSVETEKIEKRRKPNSTLYCSCDGWSRSYIAEKNKRARQTTAPAVNFVHPSCLRTSKAPFARFAVHGET